MGFRVDFVMCEGCLGFPGVFCVGGGVLSVLFCSVLSFPILFDSIPFYYVLFCSVLVPLMKPDV